jgi:hypothetical protein
MSQAMNQAYEQRHLAWLESRIKELQQRLEREKQHLSELENTGSNTTIPCRSIAAITEYLQLLQIRKAAVHKRLGEKEPLT